VPSSKVVALRKAIRTGLRTALATAERDGGQVQVEYGWPGDDLAERERVFTNIPRGDHTGGPLKSGRRFRDEKAQLDVVIQVEYDGGSAEEADERAIALGLLVEEWFADNKAGAGVASVSELLVATWRLDNLYGQNGALSELTYTVTWRARLT
jgi:hypothetical protein